MGSNREALYKGYLVVNALILAVAVSERQRRVIMTQGTQSVVLGMVPKVLKSQNPKCFGERMLELWRTSGMIYWNRNIYGYSGPARILGSEYGSAGGGSVNLPFDERNATDSLVENSCNGILGKLCGTHADVVN